MLSMSYPIFLLLTSEGVLPKIFSISIHCCSAERHLDIWGFIFTPLLSTFLELIALCLLVKLNIVLLLFRYFWSNHSKSELVVLLLKAFLTLGAISIFFNEISSIDLIPLLVNTLICDKLFSCDEIFCVKNSDFIIFPKVLPCVSKFVPF